MGPIGDEKRSKTLQRKLDIFVEVIYNFYSYCIWIFSTGAFCVEVDMIGCPVFQKTPRVRMEQWFCKEGK